MTRNEAVKIFADVHNNHTPEWAERWIDGFNALGLIKLDEPETAGLAEALGWPVGGRSHGELTQALDKAGLKLVRRP